MVMITKKESEILRSYIPSVCITITNQFGNSKQKTRYAEEASAVMALLEQIRSGEVTEPHGRVTV